MRVQRLRPVLGSLGIFWALALGADPASPGEVESALVVLEIEAPAELEPYGARLAGWQAERLSRFGRLLGLEAGSPIRVRVILASESSAAELGAPQWVAGYARGEAGVVVLFPSRIPVYPYRSLEELLGHEVAHLLIHRASGGRPVPRWFHEGLSMLAEDAWGLEDRSRVALALLRHGRIDLAELEARFDEPSEVRRAYALAGAFARDLVNRHGRSFPAELLAGVAAGSSFEVAFADAAGHGLDDAEDSFWRRFSFWYRWLPFLTSSTALWLGIALLALAAMRRRRRRARALEEQWMLEEAWSEEEDPEPVN